MPAIAPAKEVAPAVVTVLATPVSPLVAASSMQVSPPAADASGTPDSEVPTQLKQLKTKVTQRLKKAMCKPDTII